MASPGGTLSTFMALDVRKKKVVEQQRRGELEHEISGLQRTLKHEQNMYEVLNQSRRHHQGHPTPTHIINDLIPPKTRELLTELAMVEEEISRLEGQITHLRGDLKREREATEEARRRQGRRQGNMAAGSSPLPAGSYYPSIPPPIPEKATQQGFETKALHFISKAIKGDYSLGDFSPGEGMRRSGGARVLPDFKKGNQYQETGFPRQSFSSPSPSPSPLRSLRMPTPKRERRLEVPLADLLSNTHPSPGPAEEKESSQKWQPNKLSESIMKCLLFIYVRLIRTSRTMELEKSGAIVRPSYSSLTSISFRSEPSATSTSQRESRQQDPYGIFDTEESIPRDIGPYKNLVIFTAASMDPKCISNSSSIPLLEKLRVLMNSLQRVELKVLTSQQKLAFWINMYNACIMHGVLLYGVPTSSEKLFTLMSKATLNIGGNILNAHAIEHFILRKRGFSLIKEVLERGEEDEKEAFVRQHYGFEPLDPNVTFALCCGTRSSPAVKIYTGEGVTAELEKSKLEYLQASIIVTDTKRIAFPELLLQNMADFAGDVDSLVRWVCHQLPTSGTLRKSMVDCIRGQTTAASKLSTTVSVEKIPYEFEFQYLLSV